MFLLLKCINVLRIKCWNWPLCLDLGYLKLRNTLSVALWKVIKVPVQEQYVNVLPLSLHVQQFVILLDWNYFIIVFLWQVRLALFMFMGLAYFLLSVLVLCFLFLYCSLLCPDSRLVYLFHCICVKCKYFSHFPLSVLLSLILLILFMPLHDFSFLKCSWIQNRLQKPCLRENSGERLPHLYTQLLGGFPRTCPCSSPPSSQTFQLL